jgi:protein-disulfide isomerase
MAHGRARACFKHFPLVSIHDDARLAAQAAVAAGLQDKFWPMHDCLFDRKGGLSKPELLGCARAIGLDGQRFERDLESVEVARRVERDRIEARAFGIRGTPTFVVDGLELLDPPDLPDLLDAVEEALLRKAPDRPVAP